MSEVLVTARVPDLVAAAQLAETWIEAGFGISVIHHILEDENSSTAKREMMFQLGNFQFATELTYSRLYEQGNKLMEVGHSPSFAPLLTWSADAHSLLVSASGYWRALQDLLRVMPFP